LNEYNEADDCRTEHLNDVSMKACEFQSDNTSCTWDSRVISRTAWCALSNGKCKGMNERLGKKNEERKGKKGNQSLGLFLMRHLMRRDFSVPQKLLDFEAGMKQPILDKLSRAGVTRRRRMM
jgi:hypothetical protein